jgi:hypothetical protein
VPYDRRALTFAPNLFSCDLCARQLRAGLAGYEVERP